MRSSTKSLAGRSTRWKVEAAAALREGDVEGAWVMIGGLLEDPEHEAFVRDVLDVREEFAPLRGR